MALKSAARLAIIGAAAILLTGCGLFYQAGTRVKASRMRDSLQTGQTMVEIHKDWGEPDIRQYPTDDSEVWSYPFKTNSNDIMAALVYTSAKEGDKGTFMDLKFVSGRLVSWSEAVHTVPPKERTSFGAGISGGSLNPQLGGTEHF